MGFIGNAIALGRGIIVITMIEKVTAIVVGVIAASGIGDSAVRWPPA